MKFIVSSGVLLKAMQLVGGVAGGNSSLPILDNFLFELDQNTLTILGSDGETSLKTRIEVKSESTGKVAVSSKLITDIVKTFPEQPLTFMVKGNQLEIVDEVDNYYIALDDFSQYPLMDNFESLDSVELESSILFEAISNTLFATGNDAMRPTMTGVLFQFSKDKASFVATDAHRLVKYTRNDISVEKDMEWILPKKPLMLLKNALSTSNDPVKIEFNLTNAKFTMGATQWTCRLIDGTYPNYESVIPTDNPNVLTINRNSLISALKRALLFSNRSTSQVSLELKSNLLKLNAEDLDYSNKAQMSLACGYTGEEFSIGFSSKILNDMLGNLSSEDVTIEMSSPSRAGIIKPVDGLDDSEELLMLVMPVMLNN